MIASTANSKGSSRRKEALTFFAALLLFSLTVFAQPKFTATLDRDTIAIGESATLALTFQGVSPSGTPQLPNIPGLNIGSGSPSSSFSLVNGRATSSVTFSFPITPQSEGEFTIPALSVTLEGKPLSTQALKLKVVKQSAAQEEALRRLVFTRLNVPKHEFYVGEVFPVEFQLYYQNASDINMPQFNANGFTIAKAPTHSGPTRVQANGQVYNLITFRLALTPAKTGDLKLGPFETKLTLNVPRQNRQNDPFGGLSFFVQTYDSRPLTLTSETPTLRVLPLPTNGAPADFTGSVGQFTLTMTAAPTNVAVGDPVTLKIRVAGKGSLDAITLPSFENWQNFRAYPPTMKVEPADDLGIQGEKQFEVVVLPLSQSVHALPPLAFSFFDPETRGYRTATAPPVKLTVRPSEGTQPLPTLALKPGEQPPAPAPELAHIKLRPGDLGVPARALVQRRWFVAVHGAPLAAFVAAFVWRRRREHFASNPHLVRGRAAAEAVKRGLQQLEQLAAADHSERFHATAFRVLQEMLGEHLRRPSTSITESAIEELAAQGAPESLQRGLQDWFHLCNQYRYAPVKTAQELASLVPDLRRVVEEFRAFKGSVTT
ncbi:MAG: protein BatD [Verrucomicrobia bacterium]|nr:protein BatD [Verrucomicrobiota bacterium]